jgi:hypothetical protein
MLSRLSSSRSFLADRVVSAVQRMFLLVTCYVVWFEHGRVFRAAGYSRQGFLAETFWEFARLDNAVGRGPLRASIPAERPAHQAGLVRTAAAEMKPRD